MLSKNFALKTKNLYIFIIFVALGFILQQCANPGPLGGGPKDEDPPVFLGSEPVKYSRNSTPRKVIMEFDEFLVIKDLNQNLIISPPLNEDPEIKLKGKKVLIKNHKDLVYDSNTTYTYYFGNAICDLHEELPIQNFEFVFSTGSSLDSLSIRGQVLNARYLTPEEGVYVCLYKKNMNDTIAFDSLPYFVRPYYVSRTNADGEYQLNNIRAQEYLTFAVKDANNNYFFDMPNEEIAFIDSLLLPQEVLDYIPDTIPIDTSKYELMDSLWKYHSYTMIDNNTDLFMFSQDDSIPKLLESLVFENQRIDFFFKFPIRDSVHIRLLNDSIPLDWHKKEFSKNKDTLMLWLTRIPHDSLYLELRVDTIQADTIGFLVKKPAPEKKINRRKNKKKDKKEKKDKIVIKYKSNASKTLAYFKDLDLEFETPLKYANLDNIILIEDSVEVSPEIQFTDSLQRKLRISYEWKQETKYKFILPQEALSDLFGVENDSIIISFNTTMEDSYGNLNMNLQFEDTLISPVLLLLVSGEADKEKIVQKHRITTDTLLSFANINEGDYYVKAIIDYNDNGKWNTGHFGLKRPAEPVYYFEKTISSKAGWDIEESWTPTDKDRKRPLKIEKEKEEKKDNKKGSSFGI